MVTIRSEVRRRRVGLRAETAAGANLVQAIQAVRRGDRCISPTAGANGATVARRSVALNRSASSEREVKVLRQLARGQRSKERAEALGINAKTEETCRGRIRLQLGIDNLPGLGKFAIRAGLALPLF